MRVSLSDYLFFVIQKLLIFNKDNQDNHKRDTFVNRSIKSIKDENIRINSASIVLIKLKSQKC